jgi:hypothetical protein
VLAEVTAFGRHEYEVVRHYRHDGTI